MLLGIRRASHSNLHKPEILASLKCLNLNINPSCRPELFNEQSINLHNLQDFGNSAQCEHALDYGLKTCA